MRVGKRGKGGRGIIRPTPNELFKETVDRSKGQAVRRNERISGEFLLHGAGGIYEDHLSIAGGCHGVPR